MKFWDYLMWLDPYNYGGLALAEDDSDDSHVQFETKIDMKWDISDYLPKMASDKFGSVICHFIATIKELKELNPTQNFSADLAEILGTDIKRTLYSIVAEMHKKHFSKSNSELVVDEDMVFPTLPGRCRPLKNASLEFIKMIIAVFELDQNLRYEARLLKRDLLKLIGYAEFSSEAKFVNPCEPYVLSQVTCDYCNHTSTLDLTRQREDIDLEANHEEQARFLLCEACNTEYDREDIEQRLIEDVQNMICKWQLQDLRCKRCRLVTADDLREQCAQCKGSIQTMIDCSSALRQIAVLKNLAVYFKMENLEEVLEYL